MGTNPADLEPTFPERRSDATETSLRRYWKRLWEIARIDSSFPRWILPMAIRGFLRQRQFDSRYLVAIGRNVTIIRRGGRLVTGSGVRIAEGCFLDIGHSGLLSIGSRTIIGTHTRLMAATQVCIGARCMISWNCSIFDSIGHKLVLADTGEAEIEAPITIADDVWIGPYTVIMKGVTVGRNSVIGAGSIVRRDVPPNSLVYGNPARVAGKVAEWQR